MSSILTNASAMTALQTLSATNKNLSITQGRISTGQRVAEASDNAAYWSIATSMRSDNKALSSVQDALGLGAGKIDTAYTAINDIRDAVDQIKTKLVSARGSSLEDQQKIQTEIKALTSHIKSVAANANYAGSNLLTGTDLSGAPVAAADLNVVASYNRSGENVSIDTITVAATDTNVFDSITTAGVASGGFLGDIVADTWFAPTSAVVSDTDIDTKLGEIETALGELATGAASLGAAKSRIDLQKNFVSKLSDAIDRGVGQMVDADMNKESTRLAALQVQQQLGIQALSIANSNSQSILSLFR
jgi:flagellin